MSYRAPFAVLFLMSIACASCVAPGPVALDSAAAPDPADNGIDVQVAIYDNKTLQSQLQLLSGRLSQVTGIDQNSLTSRLGTLQGANSSQFAMNLQATGLTTPSTVTTATNLTPSIAQTVATPAANAAASAAPSTAVPAATGATTQTVTTTPSNTVQTVTTLPAATPTAPTLPAAAPLASPGSIGTSALDTLGEQMQLSYQIVNLQLLLQGALSDEYTPQYGLGKRHVTFGFPISISTPPQYEGDVAEVEVSVCNPSGLQEATPPTLQTLLPQQKTYNVASIVSKSEGLGVGAIIAHVINIGGSFSWTHQTYYVVKQQDTVALRRKRGLHVPGCSDGQAPAAFAWQFRPVLGQKTIDQGDHSTFAQVSFAPSALPSDTHSPATVAIRTCWRSFDAKSGIVGDRIDGSCVPAVDQPAETVKVTTDYATLAILGIDAADNGDGTITTLVHGRFPAGTRVGLGEAYLDESVPGFENNGAWLRFTASAQALAVRGPRLLSPDGTIKEVKLKGEFDEPINLLSTSMILAPGKFEQLPAVLYQGNPVPNVSLYNKGQGILFPAPSGDERDWRPWLALRRSVKPGERPIDCQLPYANAPVRPAKLAPYSDSLMKVTVPFWQCMEVGSISMPPMYVVILGGKAFGLSDAPFASYSATELTFLVPKGFVQGLSTLKLKRLFFDEAYESTYDLVPGTVSVTSVAVANVSKLDATFAITGSGLKAATFSYPWHRKVSCCDTLALVTLGADELASVKQLVLQPDDQGTPIVIALPAVKLSEDTTDAAKVKYPISIVQQADEGTTYSITALNHSPSLEGAVFLAPAKVTIVKQDGRHLLFTIPASKPSEAGSYKEVVLQLMENHAPTTIITLGLPALAKADDSAAAKKTVLKEGSTEVKQGASGPCTISGSNLDSIVQVRYLNNPLPFHISADAKSLTIEQLPAAFSANVGKVALEIRLSDGTMQAYEVTVK